MKRRRRFGPWSRQYLAATCDVRVRFQEVDAMHVVWHGNYLSYLEDGRNAFGREYGFGYQDILAAGYVAPVVHLELDFFQPARFDQVLEIETRMHVDPGARIRFRYEVRGEGTKLAAASSVQVFTEPDGTLLLTQPPFYTAFFARWAHALREE